MKPLLLALPLLAACHEPPPPAPRPSPTEITRAVDFLVAQQSPDGLWKSETSTVLAAGQALTPFVLYALSHAPAEALEPHRAALRRGLDRLPVAGNEYPSYSLALSILALRRLRPGADVRALVGDLRARQLAEENGWSESDPEYGGWDQGVALPKKPQCQRPDVSVTALAVEALGGDAKARTFAERCHAPGGGYRFTPSALWKHQNKAGPGVGYATATYDALRILEVRPVSEAGLTLPPEWEEALFFYHAYARAKVRPDRDLRESVRARQRPDGSFRNASALMKEDDPLVATGLAIVALSLCR